MGRFVIARQWGESVRFRKVRSTDLAVFYVHDPKEADQFATRKEAQSEAGALRGIEILAV